MNPDREAASKAPPLSVFPIVHDQSAGNSPDEGPVGDTCSCFSQEFVETVPMVDDKWVEWFVLVGCRGIYDIGPFRLVKWTPRFG